MAVLRIVRKRLTKPSSNTAPSLFVLFNLYCPNETNDSRLPYKLNFLYSLQSRVSRLLAQGRQVIVLGDINVCHRPIDNGEGGIQRNAAEHFDHPARKWFDRWVWDEARGTGVLHDVTREKWPKRKGMFTCEHPTQTMARARERSADSGVETTVFRLEHKA